MLIYLIDNIFVLNHFPCFKNGSSSYVHPLKKDGLTLYNVTKYLEITALSKKFYKKKSFLCIFPL